MAAQKKMNSEEIARLAGVSRSTVSRVINGYSNVPEQTRQKVMAVIEEVGYYPSFSSQVLAGKNTRTIAFICIAPGSIATDIQFSAYFAHVIEIAAKFGYYVSTCVVKNLTSPENLQWVRRLFFEERVDAGIFIGVDNDNPLVEELIAHGKIVGIFDHFHPDRNEPNRLSVNYETNTGEKVIDYLYKLGHRKIAVISGNPNRFSLANKNESFIRGLLKYGLTPRHEWMYSVYSDLAGGYQETLQMFKNCKELPTAICPYNDLIAFGVYDALKELGLRIPEDISVVGIDGHEKANMVTPKLTSFAFSYYDIFYSLVSRVIAVVEGKENVPTTEFIYSKLIERESCRKI